MGSLALLSTCDFKTLHVRRADGSRSIDQLYASFCHDAVPSSNDLSRYGALFDYALDNNFGIWVIDYVEEVRRLQHHIWATECIPSLLTMHPTSTGVWRPLADLP